MKTKKLASLALLVLSFNMAADAISQTTNGNYFQYYGPPYVNNTGAIDGAPGAGTYAQELAIVEEYLLTHARPDIVPGSSDCHIQSVVPQDPTAQENAGDGSAIVAIVTAGPNCAPNGEGPSSLGIHLTGYPKDAGKNLGDPCGCGAGDPINFATGNEFYTENDFTYGSIAFNRYYNSDGSIASTAMGAHWRHSFDIGLEFMAFSPTTGQVIVYRPDGHRTTFKEKAGAWVADADIADQLVEQTDASGDPTGWTYKVASTRQTESYDAQGKLLSIAEPNGQVTSFTYSTASTPTNIAPGSGFLLNVNDPHGRTISFIYNSSGTVATITRPDGGVLSYGYDSVGNLTSVTYPGNVTKKYVYNESALTAGANLPNALTGVVDESNVRFVSINYDNQGRALSSQLTGGVNLTQVTYGTRDGYSHVVYPNGTNIQNYAETILGRYRFNTANGSCGSTCGHPYTEEDYDANGYPSQTIDFNGNFTLYSYAANGLLNQETDAARTNNQRTTVNTWDTSLRVPLTRTVANASGTVVTKTSSVYNGLGQPLARCDIDPTNSAASGYSCSNTGTVPAGVRRWTYTYCTAINTTQCPLVGLMLTATGPRTDISQTTTYSYYLSSSATNCGTPGAACYQAGDLHTITDPQGHVTTFASYDGAGRITRTTDANGINTDLTYTPRGWLASRRVGGATTGFTYTPYGAVQTTTDADGVTTTYGYDTAHRLVKITDVQGNYVQYTLDAAGNKSAEQTYDAGGTLHKSLSRTFNTLGQLTKVLDGLNHTVFDASASGSYDANSNLMQSADGLGIARQQSYDALNRLVKTLDNYNGSDSATANTATQYTYDSLDRVTQLTDPSNFATTYSYDGLGNATGQQSPDTGTTARSFDAAGNVLTRRDAKGITVTTTYDALNRPLTVSYPDSTQAITYAYDEANSVTGCNASDPTGRLTRIIEHSVTTVYCYDAWGRVSQKQTITANGTDTTGYRYTAAGRLSGVVYARGTQVSYVRDGDGRIQSVTVTPPNGTASTVVRNVTYQPFGPVSGFTLGNGQRITRSYDTNYRLTDLTSPAFTLHVARDVMGNITAIGNSPGANPATETYSYDPLYRLTQFTEANGSVLQSVTYNPTGDRLNKSGAGLASGSYRYNPNTHQLIATGNAARSVDADGNTTSITEAGNVYGFGYNGRNRMSVAQLASSTIASYTYDASGQRIQKVINGQTERYIYDQESQLLGEYGAANREYIWMDNIPVANVDIANGSGSITYVTADELGTPRAITDFSGKVLWSWAYQGNAWGEQAPISNGYTYNLRFPGQYFDAETGLHYNNQRDYDPATGRYVQSDPLGLNGGQSSTYAYGANNSLSYFDPTGQSVTCGQSSCEIDAQSGLELGADLAYAYSVYLARMAQNATARPNDMSRLEERHFDRTCSGSNDPCLALKAAVRQAIAQARVKMEKMLNDNALYDNAYRTPNPNVTGTNTTWLGHADDLTGRLANISAMLSLGRKLGCDMSAESVEAAKLFVPNFPTRVPD